MLDSGVPANRSRVSAGTCSRRPGRRRRGHMGCGCCARGESKRDAPQLDGFWVEALTEAERVVLIGNPARPSGG